MFNKKLFVTDMSKTLGIAAKRIMVVSALPQDDAVGVTNIRCATAAAPAAPCMLVSPYDGGIE